MTSKAVEYPVPRTWLSSRAPRAGSFLATTVGLALAFLVLAIFGFVHAELYGGAVALLGSAGFVAEAAALARTRALRRQGAPDLSGVCLIEGATRVGQDGALRNRELAAAVLFAFASFAFAYGMWTDLMKIPISSSGYDTVYPVAGLFLGLLCLYELYGRGRRSRRDFLVLTQKQIAIAANDRVAEISWESMSQPEVVPSAATRQAGTRVQLSASTPSVRIDETCLGAPALLCLLDFYHRHPDLRVELSDGRTLTRLRDGSLIEEPTRYA